MNINAVNSGSININTYEKKQEITKKKQEKLKEIVDLNIESSKVNVDSFEKAKTITEKLSSDIKKHGSNILDKKRFSGNKVFNLIK